MKFLRGASSDWAPCRMATSLGLPPWVSLVHLFKGRLRENFKMHIQHPGPIWNIT